MGPETGYVTSASQILAEKIRDSTGQDDSNSLHASGALSQSMSARNVSPFSVILSIFVIVRTSSIRRSRGSLADKEKTAAGSPNPNFTADLCRPSPRCSSLKYHAAIARAISVFDFLEAETDETARRLPADARQRRSSIP